MFQRAPPEVSAFGVMTSTPSLQQIVPGLDPLRVPLAHREDHHRVRDHALELVGVPVLGDQSRFDEAGNIRRQGEGHDIRRQPALDCAALLSGRRERGVELDVRALRRRLEERHDLLVGLARRGVGHQGQGHRVLRGPGRPPEAQRRDRYGRGSRTHERGTAGHSPGQHCSASVHRKESFRQQSRYCLSCPLI